MAFSQFHSGGASLAAAQLETETLVETVLSASQVLLAAGASAPSCDSGPPPHQVIKLGIDVHLDRYVVVRQIDGGAPKPPQRFSPGQFLEWAKKQTALAQQVYSCYEAGPFGYCLHRQLKELGIPNYMIHTPRLGRVWREGQDRQAGRQRDGAELGPVCRRNQEAFCVVCMPTEAEEQARSRSRQRESIQKEKQRLAAQGLSHALCYGAHLEGAWLTGSLWKELVVPPMVLELPELLRWLIQALEQELKTLTQALTDAAPEQLPMGLGKLTYAVLERETADWNRFGNRPQVASYCRNVPPRRQLDLAALSRSYQQARRPARAHRPGGGLLASGAIPAHLQAGGPMAAGVGQSQNHPIHAQANHRRHQSAV